MRNLLVVVASLALLAGCANTEQRNARVTRELQTPGLVSAQRLIAQAGRPSANEDRFVVSNLRAAELAGQELKNPARKEQAEAIFATATSALAGWFVEKQPLTRSRYTFEGFTYDLRLQKSGRRGIWDPAAFQSVGPASRVSRKLLRQWHTRDGIGVPLDVQWKPIGDERLARFVPPRGYITPATAVLDFSKPTKTSHTATLVFLDPTVVTKVEFEGVDYPLAADFSAPIVGRIRDIREFLLALEGLVHPSVRNASLTMLEPYDPKRIPVVLVHGLLSHPRMWRDVVNDLQADPELAGRFQFWTFYYPTGWPITYSAMRLREELAALEKTIGRRGNMIFIGHSMGGLLSRMQVIEPGTRFLDQMLSPSDRKKFELLPPDHLMRRVANIHQNPDISRVVFISTPHRGSRLADLSVARWFSTLVRLPTTMLTTATDTGMDIANTIAGNPRELTGVRRLSPNNPMFKLIETVPIPVPHHSIIGDRGRGDTPNSSDGVVPYWSSHLASAESEIIVPTDHGAFHHPAAVAELKRILELQLRSDARAR